MSYFDDVKEIIKLDVDDALLKSIVFEMSRFYDRQFTKEIKKIQKENSVVFDTPNRKLMRKKFYYGDYCNTVVPCKIEPVAINESEVEIAFEDCYKRLNTYDAEKIINSMRKKAEDLSCLVTVDKNKDSWLNYYNEKRKDKLYSFVALKLNQEIFEKSNFNENIITDFILHTYDSLENYRHLALIVEGEIFNKNHQCITWQLLYKAGIFAENFIQFHDKFFPFKKEEQITKLTNFLSIRKIVDARNLAESFYNSISTGYKYEDCYISDNQSCKILIYKKIELDRSNVPCPSCHTTIQSGNSFPEMFLRSWECKNPSCPDRSKSGRGKRFDEYGIYRYFKLVENDPKNSVDEAIYQKFRRDIFNHNHDWIEFLIKEYTYSGENIFISNCNVQEKYNRNTITLDVSTLPINKNAIRSFASLPIVNLFFQISKKLKLQTGDFQIKNQLELINANSAEFLQRLKPNQIGAAITSPPYYNAREYSQWESLIMYFIDMFINCKAVFNALVKNAYYLYNIGDIVSEDNIYVVSNMSKRRVQLGFLSAMIFEIAGYTLTGNIIWDKGEVQSKRSSTVNLFSGYVKCVNCYEHVLVFRKGLQEVISNSVEEITPVIKINNKGENLYKHTAPYPLKLVQLLEPYITDKNLYVLDPFLGSGTTLMWCKNHALKGLGFEINDQYYQLCKDNIFENNLLF